MNTCYHCNYNTYDITYYCNECVKMMCEYCTIYCGYCESHNCSSCIVLYYTMRFPLYATFSCKSCITKLHVLKFSYKVLKSDFKIKYTKLLICMDCIYLRKIAFIL